MDLALHLGHGGLASLQGGVLRVSQATLQVSQSVGERVLTGGEAGHVLLLSSQLVGKTGSVNHRLLGLVLGVLGGNQHAVNLGLQGVDAGLQLALGGHVTPVDGLHVVHSGTAVSDVVLELPDGTVGSVQQGLALLHLAGQGSSLALGDADLLSDLSPGAGLVLEGLDGLTELGLVALDGLDALRVGLVGVVQANLQLVDLSLQLLLDAESLTLGSLLGLNGGSRGLHGAAVVLPGVVELLLLLSHTSVNLLPHVGELQLGAEHLVLLHLQGGLGLLQSALQLLLLSLQHPPLFVQSVNGAASLTELIQEILDLVREVSSLGLPLTQNLVKVLGSLLSDQSGSVDPLVLHGEIVQVSSLSALRLLGVGHLGGQNVHELLVLHDLGLQLVASSLQLLNAAHSLGLEARLPELSLSLGLGESLQGVRLAHGLILQLLPQVLQVSGHHLVLGQQGGTVLGLGVRQGLGVLQLGSNGDLGLVHVGDGVLQLLDLPVEVLVLHLQTLLGGLGLVESSGHLVQPGVGVHDSGLQQLALLVQLSLGLDGVLQVQAGVSQVELQARLVLLRLDLVSIQLVDLLAQVRHGVVVLHPQGGQGALLGDVELLQLGLQSGQLALSLLVELHLGGGVGAGLLQAGGDVLNVLLQHGAALLGLGAVSSLNIQLLIKLLNAGHQLLGLLGVLGGQGGLVIDLGGESARFLLLAGDSAQQLSLDTLQVGDGLLGQLQVSLQLPLGLLNISLHLLLSLQSILGLIQSLLQLSLNARQMVALVLSSLDIFLGLLPGVTNIPLLLAQLADHVGLVRDLVLQGSDLVVLVGSVLLSRGQAVLSNLHLALQLGHGGVDLGDLALQGDLLGLLTLDTGIDSLQLLLHISSLGLDPGGFVNDVLHGGPAGLQGQGQLVLLSHQAVVDSLDLGASLQSGVNVGLSLGDLVLVLLLELSKLGALQVGLDGQPDLHPEPGLGDHEGLDGALARVESHLLVLQLLESHPGGLASGSGLEPGQHGTDSFLTDLLHLSELSSAEEDLGVTQTVFLGVELDDGHHGPGSGLVILGLGHSSGGQDVVASLELGIEHLIWESLPADGDTGEHTVTLVLVHDQVGLHTSGLLVGVGHHTTDEVRLSLVQGGHQVIQLALEVGGDSLAATLLLLTTIVLGGLQGLAGVVSETLDHESVASVLVLLEPASQVVGHGGGVVDDSKMCVGVRSGVGLGEVGPLAQQVGVELLTEGLVSGLGEERLLLKDGEETHGLLKHEDAG